VFFFSPRDQLFSYGRAKGNTGDLFFFPGISLFSSLIMLCIFLYLFQDFKEQRRFSPALRRASPVRNKSVLPFFLFFRFRRVQALRRACPSPFSLEKGEAYLFFSHLSELQVKCFLAFVHRTLCVFFFSSEERTFLPPWWPS